MKKKPVLIIQAYIIKDRGLLKDPTVLAGMACLLWKGKPRNVPIQFVPISKKDMRKLVAK